MSWRYRLTKNVTVLLGMLLLGAAMGFTIGLSVLQDAAMAQNAWPTVYSPEQGRHLYAAGKQLQLFANIAAGLGAVLLLVYGLMDYAESQRIDVEAWLEAQADD